MASSSPSPSLPRKLLRYIMSSRLLGALHRFPLRVQPKPVVAVSATIAAAAATAAYYQEPAGGRHGDDSARVPSGSNVVAAGRLLPVVAERSGAPAKERPGDATVAKKTPKEGKGGSGGDHNVLSSLAAVGAVVLLHARRWLAK
ncbi:hypothetical protein PVAP13_6NG077500 [Panicum virgatum]|uniref:Uncharacterized protein n=1 Tax=Panicum virgatum TaxID=38727 RepID=A0A8T0QV52_PANVG|nr:hypothetical protein PVAP13_6NG077500 [Panicum virgatum]